MATLDTVDVSSSQENRLAAPTGLVLLGLLAMLIALVGVVGSLYLSIGMDLRACPLCFYQRTLVMSVFAVLTLGLLADRSRAGLLFLVCVPLAIGGLVVAGFHEYLVLSETLECPAGLWGVGSSPAQSLALFVLLTSVILLGARRGRHLTKLGGAGIVGGIVLGAALAYSCIASSPPMSAPPKKPHDEPLVTCRPPWKAE
jgi:hypothetical protein